MTLPDAPAKPASVSAAARLDDVSPLAILEMPVNEMRGAMSYRATSILPESSAETAHRRSGARFLLIPSAKKFSVI